MTPVKLDHSGVLQFEKAMWFARILSIINTKSRSAQEILKIAQKECEFRNIRCISGHTMRRYLTEISKSGKLVIEKRYVSWKSTRNYYSKPVPKPVEGAPSESTPSEAVSNGPA